MGSSQSHFADKNTRQENAFKIRIQAAEIARDRHHPYQTPNNEESSYVYEDPTTSTFHPSFIASFTKGLPHDPQTGLLLDPTVYDTFRQAIDTGDVDIIKSLPLGPADCAPFTSGIARSGDKKVTVRGWESMAAGLTFDLQGPDSHALAMPPAPMLTSPELVYEMSELYWMALLRDIPFTEFHSDEHVAHAVKSLNATQWISNSSESCFSHDYTENRRRRLRDTQNVFRGITCGDDVGPYISQFLLQGTTGIDDIYQPCDGKVQFGAQTIDQRVRLAPAGRDYMTTWKSWVDAQNGADLGKFTQHVEGQKRFLTTPRDLATYVHFDALYQAYLTACLMMLAMKVPFDPNMPFIQEDSIDKQQGFAHFGGPHILALVTEVSTRVLKAVRYQKFNVHRRLRPEAVGGRLERIQRCENEDDIRKFEPVLPLYKALDENLLTKVREHNAEQNKLCDGAFSRADDFEPEESTETLLLPMAYAEGSPMHPTYGAGHASVAGGCVTILKAFFKHDHKLDKAFVPNAEGTKLEEACFNGELTVEGELNKLCSNISIGRNWAGVHYFSDYIESIKLGERVALGILEEQKITYGEMFKMTVPLFDGTTIEI